MLPFGWLVIERFQITILSGAEREGEHDTTVHQGVEIEAVGKRLSQ